LPAAAGAGKLILLALVQHSVVRGTPFGDPRWQQRIVAKLGLETTVRPVDRPRKTPVE
jgi:hypothetical protein